MEFEDLKKYLHEKLNIDKQKVIAKDIAYELDCGYKRVLNRIQGKSKKRLDAIDKAILIELKEYQDNNFS